MGGTMNELAIHVDTSTPNYPVVRLLIDGEDILASGGSDQGNDPADILDTGALLPTDPPRRIAFYGCGCGEFGCAAVAGLVERRANQVVWHDFCSPTGVYRHALAEPEDGPDPVAELDPDELPPDPVNLPAFVFDADRYLALIEGAMQDRSWETRPRAVIRHIKTLRPGWTHWAARTGDAITVHHRVGRMAWSTDLDVPAGSVKALAASLVELLEQGVDPRRIQAEGLWREGAPARHRDRRR